MLKGFKDILTSILHFSTVLVQCFTSLAQTVTSQAENRKPLQRVFIVVMPEYLFETNSFRINWVDVIKKKYITTDTLGFRVSACDVTGFVLSLLSRGRGSPLIVSSMQGN